MALEIKVLDYGAIAALWAAGPAHASAPPLRGTELRALCTQSSAQRVLFAQSPICLRNPAALRGRTSSCAALSPHHRSPRPEQRRHRLALEGAAECGHSKPLGLWNYERMNCCL